MTTTLHRGGSTRAERRRADRKRASRKRTRRARRSWIPMVSVVGLIVMAAVVAVIVGSGSTTSGHETASVSISGPSLPAPATPDTATGARAPVVRGTTFDGGSVSIPVAGKPTVVVFLAHWCPHCRKDVPAIQSWINANGMPAGVALVSVSTWVDEAKPNYPPSTWFRESGWTPPVLVDDATGSVADAYGLRGTPMWVFIGADGIVRFRLQGELDGTQLDGAIARLLGR
jgi:thiol-disulfide isomerase/thioredoxin